MNNSLPQNPKEGILFGSIICALTCTVMASLNICISMGGVSKEAMMIVAKAIVPVFIIAMALEGAIFGKIAEKLVDVYTEAEDGFNSKIMFRIFFTVIGMSIAMTLVGGMFSLGFTTAIFEEFIHAWPRNFCVAFLLELLLVQPFARYVMRCLHSGNAAAEIAE